MARIFFVNITWRIRIHLSAIYCHALVVMEEEIDCWYLENETETLT